MVIESDVVGRVEVDVFIYRQAIQDRHAEKEGHAAQKEGPDHEERLDRMPKRIFQAHPGQRGVVGGTAGFLLDALLGVPQGGHGGNGEDLSGGHGEADENHPAGEQGRHNGDCPVKIRLGKALQQVAQQQRNDPLCHGTAQQKTGGKRQQQHPAHPVVDDPFQLLGGDPDGFQQSIKLDVPGDRNGVDVVDNQKAVHHKKQDDRQSQRQIPEGHLSPGQNRDRLLFRQAKLLRELVHAFLDAAAGERKSNDCRRKIVLGQRSGGQVNLLLGGRVDVGGVGVEAGQTERLLLYRIAVVPAYGQCKFRANHRLDLKPFQQPGGHHDLVGLDGIVPLKIVHQRTAPGVPVVNRAEVDAEAGLPGVSNQPPQLIRDIQRRLHLAAFLQLGQLPGAGTGNDHIRGGSTALQVLQRGEVLQVKKDAAGGCNQNHHDDGRGGDQPVGGAPGPVGPLTDDPHRCLRMCDSLSLRHGLTLPSSMRITRSASCAMASLWVIMTVV